MLIPVPLAALFVLLALVTLFEVPHEAARAVITRNVLDDEQYPVGMALGASTHQAALLLGSIGGGLLVTVLSVNHSLVLDAATFAVAAALARFRLDLHAATIDLAAAESRPRSPGWERRCGSSSHPVRGSCCCSRWSSAWRARCPRVWPSRTPTSSAAAPAWRG